MAIGSALATDESGNEPRSLVRQDAERSTSGAAEAIPQKPR